MLLCVCVISVVCVVCWRVVETALYPSPRQGRGDIIIIIIITITIHTRTEPQTPQNLHGEEDEAEEGDAEGAAAHEDDVAWCVCVFDL